MLRPLLRYVDFFGRSRRSEFWLFNLLILSASAACLVGGAIIELATKLPGNEMGFRLVGLLDVVVVVPLFAVMVRRLHDIGKSGWWLLAGFIPFGAIALIMFWVRDGNSGENRFGPAPKAQPATFGGEPDPRSQH